MEEEQKYNIILGVAFSGQFIVLCHFQKDNDEIGYDVEMGDKSDLSNSEELIFSKDQIAEIKHHFNVNDMKRTTNIINNYTFKVGQSEVLKNPFE